MKWILLWAALATPTFAEDDMTTGNGLYAACTDTSASMNLACLSYVSGVSNGMRLGALITIFPDLEKGEIDMIDRLVDEALHLCVPNGVSFGQRKDIVMKYMEDNPRIRHWQSSFIIRNALQAAFPCG